MFTHVCATKEKSPVHRDCYLNKLVHLNWVLGYRCGMSARISRVLTEALQMQSPFKMNRSLCSLGDLVDDLLLASVRVLDLITNFPELSKVFNTPDQEDARYIRCAFTGTAHAFTGGLSARVAKYQSHIIYIKKNKVLRKRTYLEIRKTWATHHLTIGCTQWSKAVRCSHAERNLVGKTKHMHIILPHIHTPSVSPLNEKGYQLLLSRRLEAGGALTTSVTI